MARLWPYTNTKYNTMKKIHLLFLSLTIAYSCSVQANPEPSELGKKPKLEDGIYAQINTSKGEILLKLEHEKTPMTVANFVGLAEGDFTVFDSIEFDKPFYDGLKFHRVIADFMIQGGDPAGNGSGGPGYKFYDEIDETLNHVGPGILSMANAGAGTNGSQFFITHKATPHLNGRHTVFGHVITGQNVVDSIAQDDVIESIEIIRKGRKAKKWDATETFAAVYKKLELEEKEKEAKRLAAEAKRKEYITKIQGLSQERFSAFMYDEIKKEFPNAKQSPSGLVYIIENPGAGEKPTPGDKLTVHYRGTFRLDGEQFDSSYDRNQPMSFQYKTQRMIAGFEEGLAMLGKEGKIKIFIPYFQAYGPNGRPGAIPPYSDLVFDLEMLDIAPGATGHEGHNH